MFIAKRLLLLLPLVALLSSCSEDFEVDAPYKPITVIYGLMNTGDTAHYIRIQKAFLDETKSALDLARVPDSNFYSSLSVHLKEYNGSNLIADETLTRVDLNDEGYKKDTGAFFNAPSFAYKTKRFLNSSYRYRLVVTNTMTGTVDSAETNIIDNSKTGFVVYEFFRNPYVIAFPAITPNNQYSITVKAPANAQVFEGILRFHYVDKDAAGVQTDRSVDWPFASTANIISGSAELKTSEQSFYNFLRSSIGPAPTNVVRYIDSIDVFIWAASNDLYTYQQINGAQGGLTADQIKPLYTNIKSTLKGSVLGLFATRAMQAYYEAPIDPVTIQALTTNPTTKELNFQGVSDH